VKKQQCKLLKKNQKHEWRTASVNEDCHYEKCPENGCLERQLELEMHSFHWAQGITVSFKRCQTNFEKLKEYIRKELAEHGVKDKEILEEETWSAIGSQNLEHLHRSLDHEIQLHKHPIKKLTAKELLRLMQSPSGHPDQEGEIYNRFDVMDECSRRGKQLLVELGWSTKMDARYYYRRYGKDDKPQTLQQILCREKWDGCRGTKDVHRRLSFATDFEYDCTHTGLSCTSLADWKKLITKYPLAKPILYEAIMHEKAFYEYCTTCYEEDDSQALPISKHDKNDICCHNVCTISRWLGIDVDKLSSISILKEADPYRGVWHLLETFTPEKPTKQQVIQNEVRNAKFHGKSTTLTLDLFS